MKILITGGNGQLGRALQRTLIPHDIRALGRHELDVSDRSAVHEAICASSSYDAVINCAALTDTGRCETHPVEAVTVNSAGAEAVACACADINVNKPGLALIYMSTNEVFDGVQRQAYEEDAAVSVVSAVNEYGRSKLEGESHTRAQFEPMHWRHPLIVRTAWLYGDGPNNFVAKVLAAARAGKPLRFVTDEIATPTNADDLAVAIRQLIELPNAPAGIYHLTNEGEASRYEWAREIVRLVGLDESRVEPITTAELRAGGYDGPRKPAYSVLANTRARALGITLRPWREALAAYFERAPVAADG